MVVERVREGQSLFLENRVEPFIRGEWGEEAIGENRWEVLLQPRQTMMTLIFIVKDHNFDMFVVGVVGMGVVGNGMERKLIH